MGKVVLESSMTRIIIAGSEHNTIIKELAEGMPGSGPIDYVVTYGEQHYDAFMSEGIDRGIMLCQDVKSEEFMGMIAFRVYPMYIGGVVKRVAYYNDLKILPQYQKRILTLPLMFKAGGQLMKGRCDAGFMLAYDSETDLQRMYEKKRRKGPAFRFQCHVQTACFRPVKVKHIPDECNRTGKNRIIELDIDKPENYRTLAEFYRENSVRYHLFPDFEKKDAAERRWIVWLECGKIRAACALSDREEKRRYFVRAYHGIMKPISHLPSKLLGYPAFPKAGTYIDTVNMAMLLFDEDISVPARAAFIRYASSFAADRNACLFSVAEGDPTEKALNYIRHVSFRTSLYTVNWEDSPDLTDMLIYIDVTII